MSTGSPESGGDAHAFGGPPDQISKPNPIIPPLPKSAGPVDGSVQSATPPPRMTVAIWSSKILDELEHAFVGQKELVRQVLIALLAGGHVLLESAPGLGKTLLVRTLGKVLGCQFGRIQFTPDLMPADVTGSQVFDPQSGQFNFRPGPIFTQLLLADEINRAPAKTQAALLEIMQEGRVTVDGVSHPIDPPFLVLATQNPIESEGTYNLPEAQLDRFLFKLVIDYPSPSEEEAILALHTRGGNPDRLISERVNVQADPQQVLKVQQACGSVRVEPPLLHYIATLIRTSRTMPSVFSLGGSPRAGVAVLKASQAAAALEGRDFLVPDDVQSVFLPALRHRVQLTPEAEIEGRQVDDLLHELVRNVKVPQS